jgi:hypothetical protein
MAIKRLSLALSLVLLLVLVTANFVYADGNADISNGGTKNPQYVIYCPEDADGYGRHWDTLPEEVTARLDGENYKAFVWQCMACGERICEVADLGYYYFHPERDATVVTVGYPPVQYWYYDVHFYTHGVREDWKFGF